MERALSAPGKLFISGEYAVLWGGVARVAAVGPRTAALVRQREDGRVHVCLEEGRLAGWATPQGVRWAREVPAGFAFVARTLDEALRLHGRPGAGFELAVAPSAVGPGGRKLGMGGSACATVLAAEAARVALEERFDALKLALLAHSAEQGGKGSGGDVAAIHTGGVVRYRRYEVAELVHASSAGGLRAALEASAPVELGRLPEPKVALAYAFTGESASTRGLIAQVEARWSEAARRSFVERSDALGLEVESGLGGEDFRALAEAVQAQHALLLELGPLETGAMRRVLGIAAVYGCAGKLSGAGGGDGCILFAPDEGARHELLEGLRARGFHAMPLELQAGVNTEGRAEERLRAWLDAHG